MGELKNFWFLFSEAKIGFFTEDFRDKINVLNWEFMANQRFTFSLITNTQYYLVRDKNIPNSTMFGGTTDR